MSLLLRSCSVLHCLGPYTYIPARSTHTEGGGRKAEGEGEAVDVKLRISLPPATKRPEGSRGDEWRA